MNRQRLSLFSFVFLSLIFISSAQAGVFNPKVGTLKNGMEVVVIERPNVPVVQHMVWYKVGAIDEPVGKSGLAHLLEHMMFRGTTSHGPGEFSKLIAKHGGEDNAFTAGQYTSYYQSIAKEYLALVMMLEADRMQNLLLRQDLFETEKKVVLEERNMRVENRPASILGEEMAASFYLNQRLGGPVIGWEEELQALTLEDLKKFYANYYAPNNAILVVAGDVTFEEVMNLAEQIYETIPYRVVRRTPLGKEPPHRTTRTFTFSHPEVTQPQYRRWYLAPSYMDGESAYTHGLQVLDEILSGGQNSQLYKHFVVEKKLAVGVSSYYSAMTAGMTVFSFAITPAEGISLEQIDQALDAFIENFLGTKINEEDISRAVRRLQDESILVNDSLRNGPYLLGMAKTMDLPLSYVENWPEDIAKVTSKQVMEAAKFVLKNTYPAKGFLLPEILENPEMTGEQQ